MMRTHIHSFVKTCERLNLLVVGDLMLDKYVWGRVGRISPEAPVPIVEVSHEENRPGGAANVARNIRAMNANVTLCGVLGADANGKQVIELAKKEGIGTNHIWSLEDRRTTVKTRVIGNNQQIARIDEEDIKPLVSHTRDIIFEQLHKSIRDFDGVIIEDYDKGLLDEVTIQQIIETANKHDVKVMVDPKYNNFFSYSHSYLFKPNLKELNGALNYRLDKRDLGGISEAVMELRVRMPHEKTLITLGDYGMIYIEEEGKYAHIPAHYRDISDVSGAGDTVISMMSLGITADLPEIIAARYANLAGGLVCESVGVVPIDCTQFIKEVVS